MVVNYTPRTWVAGETVTATELNNEIHDPWSGVQAAWDTFTPTWTALTTNPVLHNGTLTGRYHRVGQTIEFVIEVVGGSTTDFGSGRWQFTLPVAPRAIRWPFEANAWDSSGPNTYIAHATWSTTGGTVDAWCSPTTAGNAQRSVSASVPFTWDNGDRFTISGRYEAA